MNEKGESKASLLVSEYRKRNWGLVLAESCTGGLLSHQMTQISGSSLVFWGSFITYGNSAKKTVLSVPMAEIHQFGAVSGEVARSMAQGALIRMEESLSDFEIEHLWKKKRRLVSLAATGIAGPNGGSPEKPVGLCFLSMKTSDGIHEERKISGTPEWSRDQMKHFFANEGLELLISLCR